MSSKATICSSCLAEFYPQDNRRFTSKVGKYNAVQCFNCHEAKKPIRVVFDGALEIPAHTIKENKK
jgi:hypothetical protein